VAVNTNISIASAKAALDAVVDRLDTGTGANAKVEIYDGSQPDSPDDAVGTQTKLASIDLGTSTPVFKAASTGTGTETNTAVASATTGLPASDTSATASGTATWFRAINKGGTAIIDGSVGTSSADLILDNCSIASGQTVKLNTWVVKLPKE